MRNVWTVSSLDILLNLYLLVSDYLAWVFENDRYFHSDPLQCRIQVSEFWRINSKPTTYSVKANRCLFSALRDKLWMNHSNDSRAFLLCRSNCAAMQRRCSFCRVTSSFHDKFSATEFTDSLLRQCVARITWHWQINRAGARRASRKLDVFIVRKLATVISFPSKNDPSKN